MKGDISFSILSKEDGIHFIHEKNFKLMYMAMSHCLQPESQVIEREESVKIWGLTVQKKRENVKLN